MTIRIGHIPYLNMAPFHHGFGPEPMEAEGQRFEFHSMSPRVLGLEADKGTVDAGALSLVDCLHCSDRYEPLGSYGIGVKGPAQSVLLFSKTPIATLQGVCAVTDETSTSFRLLQLLTDVRYGLSNLRYGRIASSILFDGNADALLLIGDEALEAKREGIKGFPVITDLGAEWLSWQGVPFVFARWAVRRTLPHEAKVVIEYLIQKSLKTSETSITILAEAEAKKRPMVAADIENYWNGFAYTLTPEHLRSITLFSELLEKALV